MNDSKIRAVKIVNAAFIVASIFLLFCNWMGVNDSSVKKEMKRAYKEYLDNWEESKNDDAMYNFIQEQFDWLEVDASAKRLVKTRVESCRAYLDGRVSPFEMVKCGSAELAFLFWLPEADLDKLVDSGMISDCNYSTYKVWCLLTIALFFTTLLVALGYIVLHMTGKTRLPGFPLVFCNLAWIGVTRYLTNLNNELFDWSFFSLTIFPFIAVLLSALSVATWITGEKIFELIKREKINPTNTEKKICPSCGYENKVDAIFCRMCGIKLPEVLPFKDEPTRVRFCPRCGAAFDDDSVFCSKCGNKRED